MKKAMQFIIDRKLIATAVDPKRFLRHKIERNVDTFMEAAKDDTGEFLKISMEIELGDE